MSCWSAMTLGYLVIIYCQILKPVCSIMAYKLTMWVYALARALHTYVKNISIR